jgi:hypothetical protein
MDKFVDEYSGWCDFLADTHRQWDVVLQQDLTAQNLARYPIVVLPSVLTLLDAHPSFSVLPPSGSGQRFASRGDIQLCRCQGNDDRMQDGRKLTEGMGMPRDLADARSRMRQRARIAVLTVLRSYLFPFPISHPGQFMQIKPIRGPRRHLCRRRRTAALETLERRELLAVWQNSLNPFDVDDDGAVLPAMC